MLPSLPILEALLGSETILLPVVYYGVDFFAFVHSAVKEEKMDWYP